MNKIYNYNLWGSYCTTTQIRSGIGEKEWEIVKMIGSHKVRYFKHMCRGFWVDPNVYTFTVYLTKSQNDVLCEIFHLSTDFTDESLKKTFKTYPYIYKVIFDYNYPVDYWPPEGIKIRTETNSSLSESEENTLLNTLIYTLLEIEKEVDRIRYKGYPAHLLEREKPVISTNNISSRSTPSSKLEKAVLIAGVLGLKFAAKAIGAEIDIPIPTDGNGPDIDIDVDTDVNADFDTGDTPDAYADVDNQHNVSFGKSVSQLETEISNRKKDIRAAEKDINYWEYQDSIHSNPSDHYRKSIDIGLKNAGKKYDEATKKLEELMNELQKLKK